MKRVSNLSSVAVNEHCELASWTDYWEYRQNSLFLLFSVIIYSLFSLVNKLQMPFLIIIILIIDTRTTVWDVGSIRSTNFEKFTLKK